MPENVQGATGGQAGQAPDPQAQQTPPTFESWLAGQDETTKGLLDGHTKGLKSALDTERTERTNLATQIKALQAKAEKGSELEKSLIDLQSQLSIAQRRAEFAEEASKPEIGCLNPKLAWLVAEQGALFNSKGIPDWVAIKSQAPELFRKATTGSVNGGDGNTNTNAFNMNDRIRRAAGMR